MAKGSRFSTMSALVAVAMANAFNGVQKVFDATTRKARIPMNFGYLPGASLYRGSSTPYPPKGWEQTQDQKDRALAAAAAKRASRAARNIMFLRGTSKGA